MIKKYRHILKYLISPLIVFLILVIIFNNERLYPFGGYSIVQVDADYQFIPVMYRIWDFLHGRVGLIYDDIGLGNNIYISMIIQGSLFSPINLLLYLTPRTNILNFYNVLVIVKICLLSLTTYIFINYKFKVNEFYKVLNSILYALSGWVMLNYFNIMWLDCVILFPLIVMYLDKLFIEEKYLGYIITLGLSLAISYYISFFIILFILFYSCLNLYLFTDKVKSKKIIFRLGISTVVAILLSSFSLLPALYQTFISSRIDSSSVANIFDCFINKSLYLMGSPLFIILFIKLIIKYKKEPKKIFFFIVLLLLFILGLFIEPINLALHIGSHWSFPYRYSFITIFILMLGSLFYIKKFNLKGKNSWYWIITFIIILIFGIYFNNQYLDKIIESQIVLDFDNQEVFNYILIIFLISFILSYLAVNFKHNYLKYITISVSSLFMIFVYASWTMYYSDGYFLTRNSNNINNYMKLPKDGRYKMDYTVYTPSYGFIYNVPTLDNWLHVLPSSEVKTYRALGYETSDTCIRSYGGTIFSDWLLNFKYVISQQVQDDDLYTYIDQYEDFYLYKYNFQSGFGLEYDTLQEIDFEYTRPFDLQNYIAFNMFNNNIIKIDNYYLEDVEEYNIFYDVNEKGFLYFYANRAKDIIDYIRVNDKYIYDYDNYIKYLGIYDDDVNIYVSFKDNTYADLEFGFISYNDIISLSNSNSFNNNILEINSTGKNLFLPINNISGLKIYNNQELVNIDSYLGNFVSIKLDEGVNKIEIKYEMPLFNLGIILSVFGVVSLYLYKFVPFNDIIGNVSYYLYYILNLGLLFYLYIYAFIKYMV